MPEVTVVVPHWNRRDLLERLLERLCRQTYPIREVLVVDNGSTDGSVELARACGVRAIELGQNTGFSGAVNRGIEEAHTERIAVVNNDVEPAPDWLERLAGALQNPRVWFATGKLLSAKQPGTLDGTYDVLSRAACPWRAGHGRRDGPLWSRRRRIHFAPFTAAMFRKDLFRKVGLLDERFESYLEDVDFCLRCAVRGYSGVYVPEAVATHIGSATLGAWHKRAVRLQARNQLLLVAKHYPARYLARCGWAIGVGQLLWGALALRHGRGLSYLRGKLEGLAMFWFVRRAARRDGGPPPDLSEILEKNELEIFRLQRRTGFDAYWRVYFALTSFA